MDIAIQTRCFPLKKKEEDMHAVTTSDMYEAGFYICLGFPVQKVEVIRENKKVIGRFTFSDETLAQAQLDYFNGQAVVNLLTFRRAYIHLNSVMGAARKEARLEVTHSTSSGTEAPKSK
jgi:hypothetical protein